MRIFLSYGHDLNAPLVMDIRHDLEAAGHEVWIDQPEIQPGDDWRRRILDGLAETQWVLGFLSRHSVRDPGVCLDELAIALHVKGGTIATILLEGEAEADVPISVSHIQWLDMHEWAARKAQGGQAWEDWYQTKLGAILKMLASPDVQRFAGEIGELEKILRPVSQQADIGALLDRFTGREWLQRRLEQWRLEAAQSRLLWISGAAGTGKSAFAAWLGHHGKVNVIGLNLCAYDKDDRRDARQILRTLAFQVATRLPDYRRRLLDRLKPLDPEGADLARQTPASLFSSLLIEPLRLCIDGGRRTNRFLIVIDGLDETVVDGHSALAEVLAADARNLPDWIAIVVTSRPEEPVRLQFQAFKPLELEAASPENLRDLRAYTEAWLATPDAPADPALVARIVAASEGNFLYVRTLRDAVTEGTLTLDTPEALPKGLAALYGRWFRHRYPGKAAYAAVRPLISVILAAARPVPLTWLARLFGWAPHEEAEALETLGSLFETRAEAIAPFHKSLRDWLLDRTASGTFVADEKDGAKRLTAALWPAFLARPGEDAFCVAVLPDCLMGLPEVARAFLEAAGGFWAVWERLKGVAEQRAGQYDWQGALAWWRLYVWLAHLSGASAASAEAYALDEIGNIHVTIGNLAGALAAFRDGLAIRERLAASDPGNTGWQRDLSVSYNKIGDMQVAQGDLKGALAAFRDGLSIAERLAASDPGNTGWQRDLSISYEKIGDMEVAQGDLKAALAAVRDCLSIAERLAASDPGNTGWQRDLSVSFDRMGDVQVAQGDLAGALAAFRDGLAIRERLAASDPGNTGWQRDLSVSYNKIGDMQVAQGDLKGALAAFRDGLSIAERLAASDPGNTGWQRDLSISYEKIGDMQVAQGDLKAALAAVRDCLSIAERLAASDPGNTGWQRDLSVSFDRMGDVQVAQGDLNGARAAFRDGLAIRERLAASDPGNTGWQRDLWVSYNKIGNVQVAQGDLAGARAAFRDGLSIAERLAASDPGNTGWQRDLFVSYTNIGDVQVAQGDLKSALAAFRDGLSIAERLAASDPGNTGWQRDLSVSYSKLCIAHGKAGELPEACDAAKKGHAIIARLVRDHPGWVRWQKDLAWFEAQIAAVCGS